VTSRGLYPAIKPKLDKSSASDSTIAHAQEERPPGWIA
jgi:hypothetical protein